jgi:hypothetical protein
MVYLGEKDMYPDVCRWLQAFLNSRHKKDEILVFDSSNKSLSRLIEEKGLMNKLNPEWVTWDIQIDIVGFIRNQNLTKIAFVECKNTQIKLSHLSQLLGYSRVTLPEYSFIISPKGVSDSLKTLLATFGRKDVLNYHFIKGVVAKSIIIAKWDETSQRIDNSEIITGDDNRL